MRVHSARFANFAVIRAGFIEAFLKMTMRKNLNGNRASVSLSAVNSPASYMLIVITNVATQYAF